MSQKKVCIRFWTVFYLKSIYMIKIHQFSLLVYKIHTIGYYSGFYSSLRDAIWANCGCFEFCIRRWRWVKVNNHKSINHFRKIDLQITNFKTILFQTAIQHFWSQKFLWLSKTNLSQFSDIFYRLIIWLSRFNDSFNVYTLDIFIYFCLLT